MTAFAYCVTCDTTTVHLDGDDSYKCAVCGHRFTASTSTRMIVPPKDIQYEEFMLVIQYPDVHDGPHGDQVRPEWRGFAEGDKDSGDSIGDSLLFAAKTFPAGTKVVVYVPLCPECKEVTADHGPICDCGFDWNEWTREEYS